VVVSVSARLDFPAPSAKSTSTSATTTTTPTTGASTVIVTPGSKAVGATMAGLERTAKSPWILVVLAILALTEVRVNRMPLTPSNAFALRITADSTVSTHFAAGLPTPSRKSLATSNLTVVPTVLLAASASTAQEIVVPGILSAYALMAFLAAIAVYLARINARLLRVAARVALV